MFLLAGVTRAREEMFGWQSRGLGAAGSPGQWLCTAFATSLQSPSSALNEARQGHAGLAARRAEPHVCGRTRSLGISRHGHGLFSAKGTRRALLGLHGGSGSQVHSFSQDLREMESVIWISISATSLRGGRAVPCLLLGSRSRN